jgi:putative glutamine amidotransferase
MPKPLILVSSGRYNLTAAQGSIQSVVNGCTMHYIQALGRAGGAPAIVPRLADPEAIRALVDAADGLLLTGGGDVNSLIYGEEPHPRSKYQDPVRDDVELEVTRLALERDLPILGVCRGIQLLNVALGGTLIQDVPSQVHGASKHYSEGVSPVLLHSIDVEPDSVLARILGATALAVNSYHHQAVKDLGRGLRISARARDGVIEAIEAGDGRPILGVQFHPEEHAGSHPEFQAVFDWLVEAAQGGAQPVRKL